MSEVVQFRPLEYTAKQFTAEVAGRDWLFSGTLCGHIDMATPDGTWCLSPDEVLLLIAALHCAREDVLRN